MTSCLNQKLLYCLSLVFKLILKFESDAFWGNFKQFDDEKNKKVDIGKGELNPRLLTLAKTELLYPINAGAKVAMDLT